MDELTKHLEGLYGPIKSLSLINYHPKKIIDFLKKEKQVDLEAKT